MRGSRVAAIVHSVGAVLLTVLANMTAANVGARVRLV